MTIRGWAALVPTERGGQMAKQARTVRRSPRSASGPQAVLAGALLFGTGVISWLGIITAEALYPDYNTFANEISDLGASRPPDSVIVQPSATIFNTVMMVCGVLVLLAALALHRTFRKTAFTVFTALFGIGLLGVGVFPGDSGNVHVAFAMLTFLAGAVAAILAYMVARGPFRYFSVVLGVVSLVVIVLYFVTGDSGPMSALGTGGIERWVAYPLLLWVTGFGGYLLGKR